MAEKDARPRTIALIPMARHADLERSIEFYKLLGMELRGQLRSSSNKLQWAHVACERADMMLSRGDAPVVPGEQGVRFYLYTPDLVALRQHLLANGVKVSEISYPEYMPKGEVCLSDPDGYTLLIGQAD